MIKNCSNCNHPFKTKDSRQKSCSSICADILRSKNAWKSTKPVEARNAILPPAPPAPIARPVMALPPPEELPAPYAKRVHDMWAALTGEAPTRIA